MTLTSARPTASVLPAERARIFQLASLLLTYPDDELLTAGPQLRTAAADLPQIQEFLDWLLTASPTEAQRHYVQTFDLRRRSGLYLTYYLHGDTRKRGMALLMLKQRYRARGLRLADGELPDLLPIVLEFAATVGPGDGEAPLRQHRQGIELLRAALHETRTPYAKVLDAVCAALPDLTDDDRAAIAALAFDGPPVETVGLDTIGLGPDLSAYPACSPAEASR
ncbi:nitrate reductase molybdenum cofactor assembly chaperone [Actinoplanes sp. NPDC024001]|uniref:nitrate reductase molybdenum cofactor assembly chaperone n=1 Tax=unclassified Actinoplanes TaxID=2626549 RepID=UPI002E1BF1FA